MNSAGTLGNSAELQFATRPDGGNFSEVVRGNFNSPEIEFPISVRSMRGGNYWELIPAKFNSAELEFEARHENSKLSYTARINKQLLAQALSVIYFLHN